MSRLIPAVLVVVPLAAAPAHAQLAVIDPVAIGELVAITQQVLDVVDLMKQQRVTLDRMRRALGGLGAIPPARHPDRVAQHQPL